ncbi:MAG: hypothetical protein ACYDBH_01090 [Acidobacteriaceae bacterium]
MVSLATAAAQGRGLQAALDAGINALSVRQDVVFLLYYGIAVTQDQTLFWVPTDQQVKVRGALHYSTDMLQEEDQTVGSNTVIFTAEQEVSEFNTVAPNELWIGTWPVADGQVGLQVAFARRGNQFGPANLWHYVGIAVLPPMSAQILQSPASLPSGPIVSNSLPIWLLQNSFAPVYTSFLVPSNAAPPYISAHVEPDHTEALQGFPDYVWPGTPTPDTALQAMGAEQLLRDRVRLTLYGFNAQRAMQFFVSLIEYSLATDAFGFSNSPAIQDDKRTQREIVAIAQKKTIEIDATYYLSTADALARRLILQAMVSTTLQ